MKERLLTCGDRRGLLGTLSSPDRVDPHAVTVLLPNTGLEHRVGPNRLHVHLSRALASAGFPTLRLDLSGMGDSMSCAGSADPSGDLSAAMDALEAEGVGRQFAALGLCSGAHDVHRTLCTDRRLIGGAFIDGYLFPTFRFYLTYILQRATDPSRLMRKISRSLGFTVQGWPSEASPVDLDYFRQPTKAEMQRDLRSFINRGLVLSYVFTGQVQHRYNYADQMIDAFPELRRYANGDVRYLTMADHTFSQESMRAELADVVVGWMRKCALAAREGAQMNEAPAGTASVETGSRRSMVRLARRVESFSRGARCAGLFP